MADGQSKLMGLSNGQWSAVPLERLVGLWVSINGTRRGRSSCVSSRVRARRNANNDYCEDV